ncbi:galactokinase [Flavihumibacter sp. UBA7668]|uniref:galactokinase n=1 Tax=Flavihumibacter sp. UBA7668 TaxID=1946542 RepID=UPI0025C21E11|nr:galactokinase [Flavihumibacter sp. UBA7668]
MVTQEKETLIQNIQQKFTELFHADPLLVSSPGRINLIGEHTDYNNGYVLPAAIDKVTVVAIQERMDEEIHLYSFDLNANAVMSLTTELKPAEDWSDYVLGVVQQFIQQKLPLKGFNLVFGGNVPLGAGMSSSAALECAVAFALNEVFQLSLDTMQMVKLAQKAENEFVGVNCGIMDQFASMFGKKNRVLKLDCSSLEYESVPFEMDEFRIVLLDTNVKHSLGSSEYNVRRSQCEEGLQLLNQAFPSITNLRDVSLDQLDQILLPKSSVFYNRCRYVMEENNRLLKACNELHQNNMRAFGELMFGSHAGLSQRYEVSCPELDFLVEQVKPMSDVYGARMMGGGFGGCTINLVKTDAVAGLIETVGNAYHQHTGTTMQAYIVQIGDGTSLL